MTVENLRDEENTFTLEFRYDGIWRVVDNIEVEFDTSTIIGMEVRKGGKFSWKIKRYSTDKIEDFKIVEPIPRIGPKIGKPERKVKK